jgi:hypothetical protein
MRFVNPPGAAAVRSTAPLRDVACTAVGELQRADANERLMGAIVTTPVALTGIVAEFAAGVDVPPMVHTDATVPVTVNALVDRVVELPLLRTLNSPRVIASL